MYLNNPPIPEPIVTIKYNFNLTREILINYARYIIRDMFKNRDITFSTNLSHGLNS